MAKALKKDLDQSTEEKIKAAAKKLFTKKGFAATRTRDIAEEAGINLALLNYYFRSKEKLFQLIMKENMIRFIAVITDQFSNTALSFEEKIEFLVSNYIDLLIEIPDLPVFLLHELQSRSLDEQAIEQPAFAELAHLRNTIFKEIEQAIRDGKIAAIHPLHFVVNMMGLIVFPFVARPMLSTPHVGTATHDSFNDLMLERKKLIPLWVKMISQAQTR